MSRIHTVDALRGLAASIVVFHHVFIIFPSPFQVLHHDHEWLYTVANFVSNLNVEAVILFFIISGFSIRLSSNRLNLTRSEDVDLYFYKRFKRLLPLYWIALLLTLGVGWLADRLAEESFRLTNLLGNLAFLQSPASIRGTWFVPFGDNGPLWSLAFEMFFYLLFPVVAIVQHRLGIKDNSSTIWLVSGFSFSMLAFYQVLPNPLVLFGSQFLIWYLGVELAEVHLHHQTACYRVILFLLYWLSLGVVAFWSGSTTLNIIWIGFTIFMIWRIAQLVPSGIYRLSLVESTSKLFYALFGGIGLISYAIYLIHYPVMKLFAAAWPDHSAQAMIGAVITSLALSWLLEYLVKRPTYSFLKRRYWP